MQDLQVFVVSTAKCTDEEVFPWHNVFSAGSVHNLTC